MDKPETKEDYEQLVGSKIKDITECSRGLKDYSDKIVRLDSIVGWPNMTPGQWDTLYAGIVSELAKLKEAVDALDTNGN